MEVDDGGSSRTSRVPVLTQVKDIQLWLVRFQAFAVIAKIAGAVKKDAPDASLPANESDVIDITSDAGKKKAAAKAENAKAYAYLTMAMGDIKFVNLLERAKTTDWPSGLAWKFMKLLHEKYMPQDSMS